MYNSSWARREAREALAVTLSKWFVFIGLVMVAIIAWVEQAYSADAQPRPTYRGQIPGYLVTIKVQAPTTFTDGVYNVSLCPPSSPEQCLNGIAGSRFMSWRSDQWFVSLNAKVEPSDSDFVKARALLNEALRTVCQPNPACATVNGQSI